MSGSSRTAARTWVAKPGRGFSVASSGEISQGDIRRVALAMAAELDNGKVHGCLFGDVSPDLQIVIRGHVDLASLARVVILEARKR